MKKSNRSRGEDQSHTSAQPLSLGYFNLARGIGMVYVLIGHTIGSFFTSWNNQSEQTGLFSGAGWVVGGGVMAMFFLISGYGFYKRSIKKCISIQLRLLLKPYIITSCAVLLAKLFLSVLRQRSFMEHGGEYVLTYLLGLNAEGGSELAGIPIDSVGIFWFVLSLMNGWIIYNAICRVNNEYVQWMLVAFSVIGGYVLTRISQIWIFCIHTSLMAVGYLAAGSWIREHGLLERKLPWWTYILFCIPICISFACGSINMIVGYWRLGLFDIISTYCLGFLLMRLFAVISRLKQGGFVSDFLEAVGFNSIWILCIHSFEKVIFPWYHLINMFQNNPVMGIIVSSVLRGILIFIIYEFVRLFERQLKRHKRKRKGKIVLEE